MTLSGTTIGTIFLSLIFLISVVMSVKTYFKIPHPDARGMVGVIVILTIAIIFFMAEAFFWNNPHEPTYLSLSPIAITGPIYYLTIKPDRNRNTNIFMAIALVLMVVCLTAMISGI